MWAVEGPRASVERNPRWVMRYVHVGPREPTSSATTTLLRRLMKAQQIYCRGVHHNATRERFGLLLRANAPVARQHIPKTVNKINSSAPAVQAFHTMTSLAFCLPFPLQGRQRAATRSDQKGSHALGRSDRRQTHHGAHGYAGNQQHEAPQVSRKGAGAVQTPLRHTTRHG